MADHTANQVRALAATSDQPFASREEINPSITRVTRYFRYCPGHAASGTGGFGFSRTSRNSDRTNRRYKTQLAYLRMFERKTMPCSTEKYTEF